MNPGDVLESRFEIERVAGRGGAGIVYQGIDRRTGQRAAIKTARDRDAGEPRFEREISTLAALRHPAIVSYLGHGIADDAPYLVMEWLDGEDLGARLKRERLSIEAAVQIARQVAAALGAAHEKGILHRDVKPSNVFLVAGELDRVKLVDFGLARVTGSASLTTTGMVIGTPSYMAPEQARGARELDARVDVYGLGALLFHCLTGRVPYEGGTIDEVLAQILGAPVPRPSALRSEVPSALDALVVRMLSKDPQRRPADGRAAHAALLGLDAGGAAAATLEASAPTAPSLTLDAGARAPEIAAPARSIAVLSFLDMSPERDQGYLCDGIADELIDALGTIEGLRVAARISSFWFKSAAADAREIGARLGVDAILEGGVRLSGTRLRVTVQLVDVATGYQRWSHRFEGTLDDVFAIQDEIAARVVTTLRGLLTTHEENAMRRPGTNAQAYGYFLRGRQLLHSLSPASYRLAVEMFDQALEIDPHYAPAYAGLAEMHCRYYEWAEASADILAAADRASSRALEIAPQLAEPHVARGQVHKVSRRLDEAQREFEAALRINPNNFEAHLLYARMSFAMGRFEDAVERFQRAADLRLEDYQSSLLLAQALRRVGRDADAKLARDEGLRRLERQLALWPSDARALSLGAAEIAVEGKVERAVEWAQRAAAAEPDDPGVWYNIGCTYANLGMLDEALVWLARVFERAGAARDWAERDPDFDALRGDPRFEALIAKLT